MKAFTFAVLTAQCVVGHFQEGSDLFYIPGSENSSLFGIGRRSWQLAAVAIISEQNNKMLTVCINTKCSKNVYQISLRTKASQMI